MLQKNPGLLHPKTSSIKQMQALVERRDRMVGFLELRNELRRTKTTLNLKAAKELVLKHIDSLPILTTEKDTLTNKLSKPDLDNTNLHRALHNVKKLVSGPIDWNTLAKCAYPTLAQMHRIVKKGDFSNTLTWNRAQYYQHIIDREINRVALRKRAHGKGW